MERTASVDEMLQHGEDVREGSRVASERCKTRGGELVHIVPIVIVISDEPLIVASAA